MPEEPRGTCLNCGKDYTRRGMGRHLRGCRKDGRHLHLRFVSTDAPLWWLHIAVAPTATLAEIDQFLRDIWLECCGHLSSFQVGRVRFDNEPDPDVWEPDVRSMTARASLVLPEGSTFEYEYDFGSTTLLRGQHLGTIRGSQQRVFLLARNGPVAWRCACDAAATAICPYCSTVRCAPCVEENLHCPGCDEPLGEFAMPLVNSPRTGVCGYIGRVWSQQS